MRLTTLVTGGTGGIGRPMARWVGADEDDRVVLTLGRPHEDHEPDFRIDVTSQLDLLALRARLAEEKLIVDEIVNCAGVNWQQPLEELVLADAQRIVDVNVWGAVLMVKTFLPELGATEGRVLNIVSSAADVPMTHSLAYNVSKAGLKMATRQMARELRGRVCVFGVSPSKVEGTAMSRYIDEQVQTLRGWTPEQADEYQRNALLSGKELDPEMVAMFCFNLLQQARQDPMQMTGRVYDYGG